MSEGHQKYDASSGPFDDAVQGAMNKVALYDFAKIIAGYYQCLVQDGTPPELASALTLQFQHLLYATATLHSDTTGRQND